MCPESALRGPLLLEERMKLEDQSNPEEDDDWDLNGSDVSDASDGDDDWDLDGSDGSDASFYDDIIDIDIEYEPVSSPYEETKGSDSSNQTTFYGSEEGCARYTRSFTEQLTLEKNEGKILQEVFSSLPNLDYIRCSDYRDLVRRGESYDQLCHRLFDSTLQPENFPTSVQCWRVMSRFLKAMTEIPDARIKAFEIPHSRLEQHPGHCDCIEGPRWQRRRGDHSLDNLGEILYKSAASTFVNLNRLELTFHPRGVGILDPKTWSRFLGEVSDSIQHLKLHCPTTLGFHKVSFEILVGCREFKALRTLELSCWCLDQVQLRSFLKKHSKTLRELELWRNWIQGYVRDLAIWIGSNLELDGIKMMNNRRLFDPMEVIYDGAGQLVEPEMFANPEELEIMCLNGRENLAEVLSPGVASRRSKG